MSGAIVIVAIALDAENGGGFLELGVPGLTIVAVFVGFISGRRKAEGLRLLAQQLLCLRQIELNTRGATPDAAP